MLKLKTVELGIEMSFDNFENSSDPLEITVVS